MSCPISPAFNDALLESLLKQERDFRNLRPQRTWQMDAPGACLWEAAGAVFLGSVCQAGAAGGRFTLMSAVKPFLLLRVLEYYGTEKVAEWVDDEPSGLPYYSLEQLQMDSGKPRNPMINSGAMLLASKLPGGCPSEQQQLFAGWLKRLAPEVNLVLDGECLADVLQPDGDPSNLALALELEQRGRVHDARSAYEIYFRLCCLAGTVVEVARLGAGLATADPKFRDRVLSTMSRCGLYEASEAWFARTGLPAKSGVSGVMFGVWPGQGCVAVCSPWLDKGGNPLLPQAVLAALAEACPLKHVFDG